MGARRLFAAARAVLGMVAPSMLPLVVAASMVWAS